MANTRQEVVNTFDKGLIMDLNPINTPSNVLTDCLNGTYITYDGNEFQLQNDKGNIPLKYSKLKPGYLPVGTTSYGDILYVVSYNPLTNKTQIGTFPSPKINNPDISGKSENNVSIITQAIDHLPPSHNYINYTEAIKDYQKLIVYFGNKDELIINPGDQYKIGEKALNGDVVDVDKSAYEGFEKLEYFILTEDKQLINITDLVEPDAEYHYVKWKIPGYLATRWRLPHINENGFSIRTKGVSLKEGQATINCQIASDDELIDNIFKKKKLNIAEIKENNIYPTQITDRINYDSVNYYSTDLKCNVDPRQESFQTELCPHMFVGLTPTNRCDFLFDQFSQLSELIDLTKTFNSDNTRIANEYYNYTIRNNKAIIRFNVDCSIVSEGEVALHVDYVPLYKYINNGYNVEGLFSDDEFRDNVFDGVGQNIIELTLPEEEQVYLLQLQMADGITNPVNVYKILICSEFMNEFDAEEYPDYEKITMDQWLYHLCELHFDFKVNSLGNIQQGEIYHWDDHNASDHFWLSENVNTITGFVPEEHEDKKKIDTWQCGYTYHITNINLNYTVRQKYLYNFCIAEYSNSKIELLDRNITISSGEEHSENIIGNADTNCYVERKYSDQNEETTSGAMFDFRDVCTGRHLLEVDVIHGGYRGDNPNKTTISVSISNWNNISTNKGRPDISGYTSDYYSSVDRSSFLNLSVLYDVKNKDEVYRFSNKVFSGIDLYLKSTNSGCCAGFFKLMKVNEPKTVGISTNFMGTFAQVPGSDTAGNDDACYVFGIFFRTPDSKVLFLPIIPMYEYMAWRQAPTNTDRQRRIDCGWDVGFINLLGLDGLTGWVYSGVYDKMLEVLSKLKVNGTNSEFVDGYFLQRFLIEENIIDTLNLNVKYNTNLNTLLLKGTNDVCRLSSNWTFPDEKLSKIFTADWNSAKDFSGSENVLSDEKICSFLDKTIWPYKNTQMSSYLSLEEIEQKYNDINIIIKQQEDLWPNSIEYNNTSFGTSIGFYNNSDNERLQDFVEKIHSTYNSDQTIYKNKSTDIGLVCADISTDSVEQYWAFVCSSSNQDDHDYDFEDFSQHPKEPRFPIFVMFPTERLNIIDILNEEEEENEIEP